METALHLELSTLEAGLAEVRQSPQDNGRVELVTRRPSEGEREVVAEAQLDPELGLVGDDWINRGADPAYQLTLMNSRAAALIAATPQRWPLAGDNLYVDLDLSPTNLPPGTRLAIGTVVVETTGVPHRGCKKFLARFGMDALKFVNSELGYSLNLRGINVRIVTGGIVRPGDVITKQ